MNADLAAARVSCDWRSPILAHFAMFVCVKMHFLAKKPQEALGRRGCRGAMSKTEISAVPAKASFRPITVIIRTGMSRGSMNETHLS